MSVADCPFCQRIQQGDYTSTPNPDVVTFEPLNPVTPGHRLFVPRAHVPYFGDAPNLLAAAMREAGYWAWALEANLIVSSGAAATQTVPHMHVHLVPRSAGDGLLLPWNVS